MNRKWFRIIGTVVSSSIFAMGASTAADTSARN